ncbi:MAG: flagellar hook-length control protein FliK [Candidatus Zixiibacteriota bacterium]|nr:MAG: flagellar hook-length control protein FliK [candidate division Zixibacteria bacterium]
MLAPSENLLDMFPGIADQPGLGEVPAMNGVVEGQRFADVLGLLLQPAQGRMTLVGEEQPSFDMLLNAELPPESTCQPQFVSRSLMNALTPGVADERLSNPSDVNVIADKTSLTSDKQAEHGVRQLDFRALPIREIHDLTTLLPVELGPGKYEVVKSLSYDNKIELDVIETDKSDPQPIRLSIAKELLADPGDSSLPDSGKLSGMKGSAGPSRVALKTPAVSMQLLADVAAKVNVKAIEILPTTAHHPAEASDDKVEVRLFVENAGHESYVRASLSLTELDPRTVEKRPVGDRQPEPSGQAQEPLFQTSDPDDPEADLHDEQSAKPRDSATLRKAAVEVKDRQMIQELTLADQARTDQTRPVTPNRASTDLSADSSDKSTNPTDRLHQSESIRFILPDRFQQSFRPHNQTIMIKVEPEHLGPARLNLCMRGDALVARVVVDSVQAKAAVESSLHQLNDQLSRAGIKVDHLEVTVGGGEERLPFYERRPHFSSRLRSRGAAITRDSANETEQLMSMATPSSVGEISRYGVNLYA